MWNERARSRRLRPIRTGASQLATSDAVAPPANPSRARTPAVVQVGAAPAAANRAAARLRSLSLTRLSLRRRLEVPCERLVTAWRLQSPLPAAGSASGRPGRPVPAP